MVRVNFFGGQRVNKHLLAAHSWAELNWMGLTCALHGFYADHRADDADLVLLVIQPVPFSEYSAGYLERATDGALNFFVRRPLDFKFDSARQARYCATQDFRLEEQLQELRVEYKALPGVRASILYIVKCVCERAGFDRG